MIHRGGGVSPRFRLERSGKSVTQRGKGIPEQAACALFDLLFTLPAFPHVTLGDNLVLPSVSGAAFGMIVDVYIRAHVH